MARPRGTGATAGRCGVGGGALARRRPRRVRRPIAGPGPRRARADGRARPRRGRVDRRQGQVGSDARSDHGRDRRPPARRPRAHGRRRRSSVLTRCSDGADEPAMGVARGRRDVLDRRRRARAAGARRRRARAARPGRRTPRSARGPHRRRAQPRHGGRQPRCARGRGAAKRRATARCRLRRRRVDRARARHVARPPRRGGRPLPSHGRAPPRTSRRGDRERAPSGRRGGRGHALLAGRLVRLRDGGVHDVLLARPPRRTATGRRPARPRRAPRRGGRTTRRPDEPRLRARRIPRPPRSARPRARRARGARPTRR